MAGAIDAADAVEKLEITGWDVAFFDGAPGSACCGIVHAALMRLNQFLWSPDTRAEKAFSASASPSGGPQPASPRIRSRKVILATRSLGGSTGGGRAPCKIGATGSVSFRRLRPARIAVA